MTEAEILEKLSEIFHEVFDDDGIVLTPETSADDISEWDSFNHIHIIVAVEARFGVKFQVAEVTALKNVGDLVTLISARLAA